MIVQVLLLGAGLALLAWALLAADYLAVPVVIAIVVTLQLLLLIRYVESHVDTLEEFFAAVNYEDFTRRFVAGDVDSELKESFNRILGHFQDARADREVQVGYLETVIRHMPVPFLAVRPDGSFGFVNNPARRLIGVSPLSHIDQLAALDAGLPAAMRAIPSGKQQLLQTRIHQVPAELRVSVSEIRMQGKVERLYSLENLSGELTAREASAWRNLIRVLTHEIMNTLTPITSLAQTAVSMLDNPGATEDIRSAVETIARRSDGLTAFVSRYRELLRVPVPVPADVNVIAALQGVVLLLQDMLDGCAVVIDVVPRSLEVRADPQLLDQVLLNLVRNAVDAMSARPQPQLRLDGRLAAGRVIIGITDNGNGIDEHARDQIFVPFFTTKRDGSGIGLSLSRQIMTAHGGDISVQTGADGTTIRLAF
jgi:nitrogen fixation/metabolism regulation signal transduction histidine kinase